MTSSSLLVEAITALRLNVLRSALTAIGVIIGVAGIIVIGAAAKGADTRIEAQLEAMGHNTINVWAVTVENAAHRGPIVVLNDGDASAVKELVPEVAHVSREVYSNVTLVAGNASWTTEYWGVDASYADVYDVKTTEGRFFDENEVRAGARVIVLGATVAKKLFGDEPAVGRTLRMGQVPVQIIGVRSALGFVGGYDYDNFIIVPITTARSRLPLEDRASPYQLNFIDLKVHAGTDRKTIKEKILALLRERKHLAGGREDMFGVWDSTERVELMNATHATLSWLLVATTVISLVVGGVGIMNIMLVSVAERTREIGLRMAIGARERDILAQFLAEAIVLCLSAGTIGLGLGIAGAYLVALASGWPLIVTSQSIAIALAASAGVGVAFGYLPARRAARLDPIDALRHD